MQSLLRVLSLTVFLMVQAADAFAAIAYVHELQGTLTGQYGSGPERALKIGDQLDSGVMLSTGQKSTAVVKFEDGQIIVLQPDTRFAVRDYRYSAKQPGESSVLLQLFTGGMRFVTGVIGSTNREAFKLNVGTATIGVRGTDATVIYDAIANIVTAAVNAGAVALQTPLGIVTIPTGSFTSAPPNAAPPAPAPIAQATAVVAVQLAQASSVAVPINTPIVVQASAQAAVAQAEATAAAQAAAAAPNNVAAQQAAAAAQAAANSALQNAIQAATQAYQQAIQAGAVPPAPPAPPTTPAVQPQPPAPPTPAPAVPTPTPTTTTPGGGGVASPS